MNNILNYVKSVIIFFLIFTLQISAKPIDKEIIEKVAINWMIGAYKQDLGFSIKNIIELNSESKENTVIYIVNLNPEGWVMISGKDAVQPVLAYKKKGQYRIENSPTALNYWVDIYKEQINFSIDNNLTQLPGIQHKWNILSSSRKKFLEQDILLQDGNKVEELLKTEWGQGSPYNWQGSYNEFCPNRPPDDLTKAKTGCVATAMAQIMKYWEWPPVLNCTISGYRDPNDLNAPLIGPEIIDNESINWASMPLNRPSEDIAQLMYRCGVSVEMNYGYPPKDSNDSYSYGSGAYSGSVDDALRNYFDFQCGGLEYREGFNSSDWEQKIISNLENSIPIYYSGVNIDSVDTVGHAFIVDGYEEFQGENLFHINWGWNGNRENYNCNILMNELIPNINGRNYNFDEEQAAIFDIIPNAEIEVLHPSEGNPILVDNQNLEPIRIAFKVLDENDNNIPNLDIDDFTVIINRKECEKATTWIKDDGDYYVLQITPPSMENFCFFNLKVESLFDLSIHYQPSDDNNKHGRIKGGILYTDFALIKKGLNYLRSIQNSDGSWGSGNPVSFTSFAIQAFLAFGISPKEDKDVKDAIDYLIGNVRSDNGIYTDAHHTVYETSIATIGLKSAAKYYETTDSFLSTLETVIINAQNALINANYRNSYKGWRYDFNYRSSADLSCSQWAILALDDRDDFDWSRVRYFLHNYMRNPSGYYYYATNDHNSWIPASTAAGIWGEKIAKGPQSHIDAAFNWYEVSYGNVENTLNAYDSYRMFYYLYAFSKASALNGRTQLFGENWYKKLYDKTYNLKTDVKEWWDPLAWFSDKCYWTHNYAEENYDFYSTSLAILSLQTGTVPPNSKFVLEIPDESINKKKKDSNKILSLSDYQYEIYDSEGNYAGNNSDGGWITEIPNSRWILNEGSPKLEVKIFYTSRFSIGVHNITNESHTYTLNFYGYLPGVDRPADEETVVDPIRPGKFRGTIALVNSIGGLTIFAPAPEELPQMKFEALNELKDTIIITKVANNKNYNFNLKISEIAGDIDLTNVDVFAIDMNDDYGNTIESSNYAIIPYLISLIDAGSSSSITGTLQIPDENELDLSLGFPFEGKIVAQTINQARSIDVIAYCEINLIQNIDTIKTCQFSPVQLTPPDIIGGSGKVSYQWEPAEELDNPYSKDPTVIDPDVNTTFRVTITDSITNEILYADLMLIVPQTPVITDHTKELIVCYGDEVRLLVNTIGGNNIHYQWQKENNDIPGANNSIHYIEKGDFENSGIYRCIVTDETIFPCINSDTTKDILLYVSGPAEFITHPKTKYVSPGSSVNFEFEAQVPYVTGVSTDFIRWQKGNTALENNNRISGARSSILSIRNVQLSDTGSNYYVEIIDPCTKDAEHRYVYLKSNKFGLHFTDLIAEQPEAVSICSGDTLILSVVLKQGIVSTDLELQWYKDSEKIQNNNKIFGANELTITIFDVSPSDSGGYYLEIFKKPENITIVSDISNVNILETPKIIDQPEKEIKVVQNESLLLVVNVQGSMPLVYQWYKDGNILSGENNDTLKINNFSSENVGVYYCIITNDCGNVQSSDARVIISNAGIPPTIVTQPRENYNLTEGQSLTIFIEADGSPLLKYQWYKDNNPLNDKTNFYYRSYVTQVDEGIYKCKVWNDFGEVSSNTANVSVITDVERQYDKNVYTLFQNEPNPFNDFTIIKYKLPNQCFIKITIYDILGKKKAILINNFVKSGTYELKFNPNEIGLNPGIYFYALTTKDYFDIKKMILLR